MIRGVIGFAVLALLAACAPVRPVSAPPDDLDAIEAALHRHIEVLASDEFGGRAPGTEGETQTLRYLAREWQAAGLDSGTNDPSNPWFAPVELATSPPATGTVEFHRGERTVVLPREAVTVLSSETRDLVERAPMLFLGSGAVLDPTAIAGHAPVLTLDDPGAFGRIEQLAAAGAAAVVVIAARADLAPIVAARNAGGYRLAGDERSLAPIVLVELEAAMAQPGVAALVTQLRDADAAQGGTFSLPFSVSLDTRSRVSQVKTHNLIARLPGRDPRAGAVLLLAHWDHFGTCGEEGDADRICNGAVDNASGLAVLTELARLLAQGPQLDRDVYFLATTAEEWGLLGAYAFTRDPPLPLDTIVAAFNLDTSALAARDAPVAIVGAGLGPLDGEVEAIIAAQGRRVGGRDLAPLYARRQDGWALVQSDVPALMVSSSFADSTLLSEFERTRYHRADDELEGIELGGAAQDLLLHLALVRHFGSVALHPGARE